MITPEEDSPAKPGAPPARDFAPYLAEASEVLASSLDYEATLASLARLVVPALADWCAIDVLEEDDSISRLAVAHEDPEKVAWARELRRLYPPEPDAPRGVPWVLRSGRAEFYPEVTNEALITFARDGGHLRLSREVGFTSVMIVPLIARRRTLGAITLVSAESGRRYEPDDLALAEDLARRAALAVDNARLYREAQREITERMRTEEELRESEARFRAVYESSPIGIANVDVDGRFVQTNRAFREMLGYTEDELGDMTFEDVTHPEDIAESREVLARLAEGKLDEFSFEKRYHRKDGREIWCRLTVSAVRDASGRFLYTVTMDEDITEHKKAEQELRESEERYRVVAETASDGIVMIDEDSRMLFTNSATGRIFGYPEEELIGQQLTMLMPEYLRRVHEASLRRYIDTGERHLGWDSTELPGLHRDGREILLEVSFGEFVKDGRHFFTGFIRDITERKRTEQTLRRSRKKYEELVNSLEGIVWEADAQTVEFTFVSEQAERLLGYSPDRWISEPTFWQEHIHPDDRERAVAFCAEATAQKRDHELEYRMVTSDGRVVWLRDIVTVAVENDQPVKLQGVMVDITGRKRAEQERIEKEEQYRGIFEETSDGLIINDPKTGKVVEANPAACRMHGCTREEFLSLPGDAFIHPDYHHLFSEYLRTVKEGGEFWTEAVDVRKDGTSFPVEVHGTGFTYRGEPHILGVVRDITERKRAEEEIEERRRALTTLMSNLPGMAYRCRNDPDWTMELVSEGSLELTGHAPADLIGNRRVSYGDLIHPDDRETVWEKMQAGLEEHRPFQFNYRITTASGEVKWVWEQGRGVFSDEGELLAVEGFITDVTERFRSRRLLEQRVASLTRIAENLTVEKPMEGILNSLAASVVEASTGEACSVTLIDEASDAPIMAGSYGLTDGFGEALEASWRAGAKPPVLRTFHDREARFLHDARRLLLDDPLYAPAHPFLRESPLEAAFILPLVTGGRTLGAISVYYPPESEPTEDERAFLGAVTDQAAVVVENARLYEDVRRRVQERSTLLEISNNVASTLKLEPLLDVVLEQLKSVVDYVDASLLVVEGDELKVLEYRGPTPREKILDQSFPLGPAMRTMWQDLARPEPIVIDDILGDEPPARAYRESVGEERLRMDRFRHIRSWLGVPMVLKGRFIGLLAIIHTQPGYYTKRHAELARTVANQAAIAIENARLYERAQGTAALEERQHLARELHDSVSQALYGIALGAKTARTLLDRDPSRAADPLDYVLSLSEAGVAEMRALIFELRPESLENEGLIAALEKQAAALRARHQVPVRAAILCEEPEMPLKIKEALYRIAQEALHNTVKHAQATSVDLELNCGAEEITLEISDDGVGFDPLGDFPGHLGLHSMRERAERLGGTLEVESRLGKGTHILARVPSTTS